MHGNSRLLAVNSQLGALACVRRGGFGTDRTALRASAPTLPHGVNKGRRQVAPHVIAQAARYGWPTIYLWREFAEAGRFASYGPYLFDGYRQTGFYAARILKDERPADLPVQQPTKSEFVISLNGKGARPERAAGITEPC